MRDKATLREWLRKELALGSEELEAIWEYLEENRWISSYYKREVGAGTLLFEADQLRKVFSRVGSAETVWFPPPRRTARKAPEEVSVTLDDYSQRRAQAFSEVAAALAQDHPEVRSFREHFLNGRLLTNEEAGEFLDKGEGLEDLRSLGKKLCITYRWREGDAEWFVLTGEPPPVPALRAQVSLNASIQSYYPNTAEITLTIQPWVNAEEVVRIYRDIQRQVLGGDNRRLHDRTLDAVRFVTQQIREHGEESWSRRLSRWNRERPKWRYASFRGLRQVFERFVHPHYEAPKYAPYEPTPYQTWRNKRRHQQFEQIKKRLGPEAIPVNRKGNLP
jgi:hypothetical protein